MKKDIRKQIISKRDNITILEQIKLSSIIAEKLTSLEEWKNSNSIMLYTSINSEVMTLNLITRSIEENKILILPKVSENQIIPIQLPKRFTLKSGYKGILEPTENKIFEDIIDLAIIPLVGFDENGYRLGYGGGFYDRFLSKYQNKIKHKIGLGYECQKVKYIPIDNHDIKLDIIITEKNIYRF